MWKLAVVQDHFNQGDTRHNLKLMESHIVSCMREHPETKLILFPELAVTGYALSAQIKDVAEHAEGQAFAYLSALARQFHVYIGYGFVERGSNDVSGRHVYNSMNVIAPNGERIATYQKLHLTPLERHLFTPGERLVTVQTDLGRFGLLICWDMAFPEMARLLAMQGAELLLAPSAWEVPYALAYRHMALARALDNVVFVATCNHTGRAGELQFFGASAIYSPDGRPLNEAKEQGDEFVVAQIDLNARRKLQEGFYSMWDDRRSDLYSLQWKRVKEDG